MRTRKMHRMFVPVLALAGILASAEVAADKPAHAGGGKETKETKQSKQTKHDGRDGPAASQHERGSQSSHASGLAIGTHFTERDRTAVAHYYDEQFRHGRCPPGLAKKNNGCMPPGLAKRWTVGRPLPGDVVFHDLPPEIAIVLGTPPAGHRYVRVARDILLITIGTGMVVDGLDGLLAN